MRDVKRINRICNELAEIWKKVPDWRLGQVMANFIRSYRGDIFFIEDDDFMDKLNEFIEPHEPTPLAYYAVSNNIVVVIDRINIRENTLLAHFNREEAKEFNIESDKNGEFFSIGEFKVYLNECVSVF